MAAVVLMMRRHFSGTRSYAGKLRNMNSVTPGGRRRRSSGGVDKELEEAAACWVPDPRTGIYFPRGQEWVMEDVPENAARLGQSYWLRNVDGVEKPDPDNVGHADDNLSDA